MNSQEDEMRCRCAYNTSLNTQREMTGDCGGRKTAAEACAPTVKCCTASAAAVPCVDPCAKPCVDPCAKPCVDPCAKPCVDPCAKPCVRPNTRCGEKPAAPCYDSVRPPCAAATKECEKPKSCNGNDRAGVMNICEKPRTCYEFTRPCSRPDDCERPRSCNPNICTRLDDGCGSFDLTPYGQQFAICTKRVVSDFCRIRFIFLFIMERATGVRRENA